MLVHRCCLGLSNLKPEVTPQASLGFIQRCLLIETKLYLSEVAPPLIYVQRAHLLPWSMPEVLFHTQIRVWLLRGSQCLADVAAATEEPIYRNRRFLTSSHSFGNCSWTGSHITTSENTLLVSSQCIRINLKSIPSTNLQIKLLWDIRDLANIRHIQKFNKLIETLAAQCGQLLNITELANTAGISRPTVENYLFILEQTYVIQLLRPFSRNIRAELFKTPKVFFHDTGIAHLLWLKTFPKTILGSMLENAVFGELRKDRELGEFFYWRTQDGKEIDFIVPRREGILPVEVKIAASKIRRSALQYFHERYKAQRSICLALGGKVKTDDLFEVRYPWEGVT